MIVIVKNVGKAGHFAKVCLSKSNNSQTDNTNSVTDISSDDLTNASIRYPSLPTLLAASLQGLKQPVIKTAVNGHFVEALD